MTRWLDANLHGQRVMIGGAYSFYANDFADIPQLHGGQEPILPDFMLRIATFTIYSGMNAGARDGEVSVLWLKALGAQAISVPGRSSEEYYKPFVNPRKFDGLLPVLWQGGGDTIYGVPAALHFAGACDERRRPGARSAGKRPRYGATRERYVAALDSPALSAGAWRWTSRHSAVIDATVAPGQADLQRR